MSGVTGIDAASGGWVIARITQGARWELDFVHSPYDSKISADEVFVPSALVEYIVNNRLSLIDMPVGLVSRDVIGADGVSAEAAVHREAAVRRLLRERVVNGGRYVGSVFPTPVYEAVYAPDYVAGVAVNKEALGKSITKQAWNLVYRIKQIQAVLSMVPGIVGTLLEAHPETVFRLLHTGTSHSGSRLASKRTQEGVDQRLNILEEALPGAVDAFHAAWHNWGRDVRAQRDDVTDAMVLALCAYGGMKSGELRTPLLVDGALHEQTLPLVEFSASKLGSGIHNRRRDILLKAVVPDSIPRGVHNVPLCMVYCPAELCKVSR
ncbi:MAG: DUF429 domain-containing protein [Spirochaeta sp.]